MLFNRRFRCASSDDDDDHVKNARNFDVVPQAAGPGEHRRNNIDERFNGGAPVAPILQHRQLNHERGALSESEKRRYGFQNPFTASKSPALGSAGRRAYVQGQERLPVSDYTGESNRADEPGTGWRLLQALDELRLRERYRRKREEEREIRMFEWQGRKKGKEREKERQFKRRYSQ